MRKRVVVPEILDELPADDPRAVRSRRDLRLINSLMGNFRWIERSVAGLDEAVRKRGIVEIGAGDGQLAGRLSGVGNVTAVDLIERPEGVDERVKWLSGDVHDLLPGLAPGVVVANLFVHHFDGEALAQLGETVQASGAEVVVLSEPLRSWRGAIAGTCLWPVVNDVTWHDMHVSIRAGFRPGELPSIFGGGGGQWEEKATMLGGLQVIGRRSR